MKIGSYTFTAGPINPVDITGISIMAASGLPSNSLTNLEVMDGTTQVGSTYTTVIGGNTYSFNSNSPIVIAANGSLALDVYASINSNASSTMVANATTLTAVNNASAYGYTVSLAAPVSGQSLTITSQATSTTQ